MSASGRQPDPGLGIFETLLVVGGEPVELEAHLARLRTSLADLYGAELPADAAERARAVAAESKLGRLRLTAVPDGAGLELEVRVRPVDPRIMFPSPENGARLRTTSRPGGHGPYKWVDRTGMDRPETGAGQLICDGEELLEAGWANLFAVREGTLWTPAADGRILPGMARAAIQEIAREEGVAAREGPLRRDDLLAAQEVFLTNSVRGVEPAIELDGAPLPGTGPLSRRLAAALRQRWGLPDAAGGPAAPADAQIADQLSR
ncbi:MAG TPA: aminotransferase class IV [Solirubrobacterales bacterium]|nr:aminotransferase class IV [Solirubrobacterales bacterium]